MRCDKKNIEAESWNSLNSKMYDLNKDEYYLMLAVFPAEG